MKPLLFVIMPFGKKTDFTGAYDIDFDYIYTTAIKPAAVAADLEVIRADEERSGGIIHIPMFERLLLAEIVIADLTLLNANVFYELGVRHCARPRTTILIYAKENQLPFDVHMIRAIPYTLDKGVLSDESAAHLKGNITTRLEDAKCNLEATDSPLFQLISAFPGIELPHEVTENFRDRARYIDSIRDKLKDTRCLKDKTEAIEIMKGIEQSFGDFGLTHSEVLVDLLLSYRDVEAYSEMISLVDRLPKPISEAVTIREQYSFALNRRNNMGDRQKAIRMLIEVIDEQGNSPETCGLLGRIYKDSWTDAINRGDKVAESACLDEAITWYRRGFEADPRDYYPGINLVTLLLRKGTKEAQSEIKEVRPVVAFAVSRRGGINSRDYWDVATIIELSVIGLDWKTANRAAEKAIIRADAPWNLDTTANNLRIIRALYIERNIEVKELDVLIKTLENAASRM
jgi:tetratricopeptide (TPR) repeat protein